MTKTSAEPNLDDPGPDSVPRVPTPTPVVGTIAGTLDQMRALLEKLSEADRALVYFDPIESDTAGLITFPLGLRDAVEQALGQ